jgi:hypothetical protein
MATPISADAARIIDRLQAAADGPWCLDRARAEAALAEHFRALGLNPLPVVWVTDAEVAYLRVFRAAESAAGSAAESAAWSAARSAARSAAWSAAVEKQIRIWLPFLDAYEAGLWVFFVCRDEVVVVPRPVMRIAGEQLHCEDGPAVQWPGGAAYYFWRGLQVPADIILKPDAITVPRIFGEPNVEIRRVLIERYGSARFLKDAGAAVVSRDAVGVLYQMPLEGDESLTMVDVVNSTPEPDGSFKHYLLRVPPYIRTARGGIAWSFDLPVKQYRPVQET